jgi:hypothetical protein
MANMTATDIEVSSVCIGGNEVFKDDLLTFAGTDTFVKGTILARRAVALVPTASAVQGGTGTGTVTALAVTDGPIVPMPGVYVLQLIEAVAHGGVFKLTDPNGQVVAPYLAMNTTTGAAAVFEAGGLRFTVTDATDFVLANYFEITVAADGTLVPYNPAGAGGEQIPTAVLTYEVSRTGAGTVKVRALVKGSVNKNRLVIDVDGTNANVTDSVIDKLRDYGIIVEDVKSLPGYDQHD